VRWIAALAAVLVACGSPAVADPAPTVRFTPEPAATPTAAPTPAPCTDGFTAREGSRTTIRVREQLGFIPAPFDAVMTTSSMAGSFAFSPDGSFAACSRLIVDVRSIRSADTHLHPDILNRDEAIAELLDSRRFATATLVPVRADGLPSPLPERGTWTFTLHTKLTIREIQREIAWAVSATRDGGSIDATATTAFAFPEFEIERPSQVLSLEDKIRLEVKLVATR
jgi:hypothetical protein